MSDPEPRYAGIATRAAALAIDALIAQLIVITVGAVFALVGSLVDDVRLDTLGKFLVAVAWIVGTGGYFVLFWSTAGQTPGMRLMGLRVIARDGTHPGLGRSIVRVVGLVLAIVPLFAGFLPVLIDDRRRGLQDLLAGTVVVYEEPDAAPVHRAVTAASPPR
jgi:uncharacterized RDD family membrane protein YckC